MTTSAEVEAPPREPGVPASNRALADCLGDEIAECAALSDAAMHMSLTRLRRFIELGLWVEHGAFSPVHWCSWRLGWSRSTAKTKVRVAKALAYLPLIDEAFRRGEISYSMVRALVRIATPQTEAMLLAYAREATGSLCARIVSNIVKQLKATQNPDVDHLLEVAFRNRDDGTVEVKSIVLPEQARVIDAAIELKLRRDREQAKASAPTGLPASADDAAIELELRRDREEAKSLALADLSAPIDATASDETALDEEDRRFLSETLREVDEAAPTQLLSTPAAATPSPLEAPMADDEPPPPEDELEREAWARRRYEENQRQAKERKAARVQALVSIFEEYVNDNRPSRFIPGAVDALVIVDHATLASATSFPIGRCELSDGTPISPETARRLTCDCPVSPVLVGPDGNPLDVGRRTRQISPALWKALILRDRHCTFPGCERGGMCLNAHHMKHWAQGGETNLENLTLTCRGHHRFVHEGGYSVVRLDDQRVVYVDPSGRPVGDWSRPTIDGDPLELIRERAQAMGIVLDKRAVREKVGGLCEADMCATVGYILENTPGSQWFRPRPGLSAVSAA